MCWSGFLSGPSERPDVCICRRDFSGYGCSGPAPGIIVCVKLRIGLDVGDRDFFFHQPFGNPHTAQPVKGIVIDFADDRRCLRVNNEMALVLWVTHQSKRRHPSAELSLPGTGRDAHQYLFGNILAIHIVHDILKGRDVHLLTGQAIHTIGNGNIAHIVFGEKDLDITQYNSYQA